MSDTTDPEVLSLITNMCKPPINFDFPKAEQPFGFVWFKKIPCVCYSWWENRTYCLPCVLFGHKNVGRSLQKTISKLANSSKNIQRNIKMFQWEHTKRGKYCFKDF